MWHWALLPLGMVFMPRIHVVSPDAAKEAVLGWPTRDASISKEWGRTVRRLEVRDDPSLMCACVVRDDQIYAVSLIERIDGSRATLWTLAACDYESGTALLRAFNATMGPRLHVDGRVPLRWQIAWKYMCE